MKEPNFKFQVSNPKFYSWRLEIGTWNLTLGSWFLVLGLLSSCSHHLKTDEETDRELMLRNQVKSMTEFITTVYVGIEKNEFISKEILFDRNGLKRKIINHGSDGSIESTVTCDYDKNNNLVLTKGINSDSTSFKEIRNYDKNNNRIDLYHYLPDGTYKYRNVASYDTEGRMTELDWYWPTGLKAKRFYYYDGTIKTEETEYSLEGALVYKWKYKYDSNHNLTEAVQYKPDNMILSRILYAYGNDNQLIKKIFYSGESIQNSQTYEYDKNGLLSVKNDFNPFGKVTAKYRYQYEFL